MHRILLAVILSLFTATTYAQPTFLVQVDVKSPRSSIMTDSISGSLVDPEYVLTNSHLIGRNYTKITVRFKNGDEVGATVAFRSLQYNLVLLQLDETRYEKPAELHEGRVDIGQTVTVWGYVGGEAHEQTGKVLYSFDKTSFRVRGRAATGVVGGPALIGDKLVGVEQIAVPGLGIRCANTPQIRGFLENISED